MNLRQCLYFAFKIKDGLFIGDINSPNERDFLVSNKITCIVNCAASQIKPINLNLGIKFISFDWQDNDDQIIIDDNNENMSLIYEFISRAYENCESVLVCSVRGQSRALTVITAFLMKRYQWSLYKTLEYMNSKRADFEIRATFLKQLLSYEQKLFGQKGCSRNWKDDHQHPDQEASLVRNTYVNSQMVSLESRDFFMRSLASREYNSGPRTTKLKWSIQLKMEIPHHDDIQSLNKKQNANQQNQIHSNNLSINNSQNNSGSNQSMKNNSNCTASNSSNQMDSVEILPINQNTFQVPKKSILKAVSSYDKKNINSNSSSSQGQNSISSLSEDSLQNNQQSQPQKKKEIKKVSLQKNYDLIEEQNEEYEQSSSEIFLTKQNQKNNQMQQSSPSQKPLNEQEKELLVEQQQSARSYETNSSGERVEEGINVMLESDTVKNSNDFETNRLNSNQDEEVPALKLPIKQKDRNEIKIFEQNSDRFPKAQINPPAAPTYAQNQKSNFQVQKEKMKNNYFREENSLQDENKSTLPPQPENPTVKSSSQKNNQREEVRVIAVEESDINQDGILTEQYKVNYQISESNLEQKNNNLNNIVNKNGGGGYQILNDQQIKNEINLSQYQINNRQTQSLVSQPGSNSSSRQTTPSRKYRKSPFPMAMPQRKIIQSQTAPQSRENSRKNSVAQIDQSLQIQAQGHEKKLNGVKQMVSKSPDSSQLLVNINLNINSVNILNQTTNPIYQRQKSPVDTETQNISMLQSNFGKTFKKSSRPPSETKKRPVTEKVYTEGNQIKDLEQMKPSSTKLTRRLQTYTNGDPLNFLPNITFMRQRTPLKNNINLPNTQNLVPKAHKNLEISFQDITTTPNNQAYLQSFASNNPNSQQLYTNYLNDVDISSQQNTVKSNTSKLKGFKRDNTPVTRAKIPAASPYNSEIRSSSNFDQRRVSTEIGQTRGSSEIRGKRSVSRGKEKDLNNNFSQLNIPINNSGTNTPISTGINPQLMAKYIKNGIKPSYNKLLY
ncbi:hypothetical protein ABPG72_004883 [Tetrahymena utriculariae]